MTMKRRETSRGDLTDKLRGMIVKRMKERESGKGPAGQAGIHSAGTVGPDVGQSFILY